MEFRNIRAWLRTYGMPPEVGDRAVGTLALAANWLSSWVWWMCYYSKNSSETKWNQVTACDCGLSCLQGLLRKKKTLIVFCCSVQSLSHIWLFATPWTAAHQASLSIPTLGVYSNSCPSSQRCHTTISSSDVLFSYHLQSFSASGSFPMSRLFDSGGQGIGASASVTFIYCGYNFQV